MIIFKYCCRVFKEISFHSFGKMVATDIFTNKRKSAVLIELAKNVLEKITFCLLHYDVCLPKRNMLRGVYKSLKTNPRLRKRYFYSFRSMPKFTCHAQFLPLFSVFFCHYYFFSVPFSSFFLFLYISPFLFSFFSYFPFKNSIVQTYL
jgi:hypothetical protein